LLDSRGDGGGSHSPTIGNESSSPILVFNPLSIEREDVVEATIPWHGALPKDVRVLDPNGKAGPAQIVGFGHESLRLVFLARVGSVGFSVFQLVASEQAPQKNSLKITERSLENDRYRVTVNDAGDVAWIYDKRNNRELLSSPARLALLYEKPRQWPAWNMDWKDRQQPPRSYVGGPAKFRITERGPVRVALEITREHEGSTFVQTIRLAAGDAANRVEFDNTIDWLTRERSLKAAFPLTVSNPKATYDIQVGTIERDNNNDKRYENPSHQWFNLTDVTGDYGVTIANDCKYGSDKPDDSTLRLTLLYTPGASGDYQDQATQDLGRHHMLYAVAGHEGDWRTGGCESAPWMAARVNQPLIPFVISKHNGASALGRSFSLLKSSSANVMITAAKKAENDDRVIIRLRELTGENKAALVSMTRPIAQAASVDGQERRIADALIKDGELVTQLQGYGLSAYSVKCGDFDLAIETDHARGDRDTNSPRRHITESSHVALALDFDCDVASSDTDRADGSVESPAVTGASAMARGSSWSRSYPAEQLGTEIHVGPGMVQFKLGPVGKGQKNALRCRGQVIELPAGKFNRVELLAASSNGDRRATFTINQTPTEVLIPFWRGYIGQWDNRVWLGSVPEIAYSWPAPFGGLEPGYVKQAEVAWFSSHHHHHHHADWERSGNLAIETDKSRASGDSNTPNGTSSGDQYYEFCYLYRISLDIPANAGADGGAVLTLPQDEHVFLMAATAVADAPPRAIPAAPLFDLLDDRSQDAPRISPQAGSFADVVEVRIQPRMYGRADAIRYTLDGTNPAPDSPSVKADEPVLLNRSATIRAAAVDASGHMGPESLAHLEVNDRTPPRLLKASAGFNQPFVKLVFSEPLSKGDAGSTSNYAIEPQVKRAGDTAAHQEITVLAASVVDEPARASGVILTLTSPLESGSPYVLRIRNLKDESPAQNTIGDMNVALVAPAPVFRLSDIDSQHRGQPIHPTEKLPTKGDDPWTLNMFVRTDKQPPNRTIIAGFGACGGGAAPQADATGRYICKFGSGIHFWSHHADLQGNTPLDLNRWQMITATYDGKALRLYKDGALLSQREVALANDEPVVSIAPIDPWDKKRRFEGDIRELTIWDTALDDDAIKSLLTNLP
jgi:alpha-mannosidase